VRQGGKKKVTQSFAKSASMPKISGSALGFGGTDHPVAAIKIGQDTDGLKTLGLK
jgi:hypothetical protein